MPKCDRLRISRYLSRLQTCLDKLLRRAQYHGGDKSGIRQLMFPFYLPMERQWQVDQQALGCIIRAPGSPRNGLGFQGEVSMLDITRSNSQIFSDNVITNL